LTGIILYYAIILKEFILKELSALSCPSAPDAKSGTGQVGPTEGDYILEETQVDWIMLFPLIIFCYANFKQAVYEPP
jgi:hypothetical protein